MKSEEPEFTHRDLCSAYGCFSPWPLYQSSMNGWLLGASQRFAKLFICFIDFTLKLSNFWSKPLQLVARIDFFRYVAYLTYFPLVVAEFVLHFVSDPFPMPKSHQVGLLCGVSLKNQFRIPNAQRKMRTSLADSFCFGSQELWIWEANVPWKLKMFSKWTARWIKSI